MYSNYKQTTAFFGNTIFNISVFSLKYICMCILIFDLQANIQTKYLNLMEMSLKKTYIYSNPKYWDMAYKWINYKSQSFSIFKQFVIMSWFIYKFEIVLSFPQKLIKCFHNSSLYYNINCKIRSGFLKSNIYNEFVKLRCFWE